MNDRERLDKIEILGIATQKLIRNDIARNQDLIKLFVIAMTTLSHNIEIPQNHRFDIVVAEARFILRSNAYGE